MEHIEKCCMCSRNLTNLPIIIKGNKYCEECANEKIRKDREDRKNNEKA